MPTKLAAASSLALVATPPQDPLDLKIQEVEQAIEALQERIALLKQQKAVRDAAATERAHREQLQRNWQALAPKREALAELAGIAGTLTQRLGLLEQQQQEEPHGDA